MTCKLTYTSDTTNHENGSFGEYLVAKAAIQLKIPDNITDTEASTLGVSTITVVSNSPQES